MNGAKQSQSNKGKIVTSVVLHSSQENRDNILIFKMIIILLDLKLIVQYLIVLSLLIVPFIVAYIGSNSGPLQLAKYDYHNNNSSRCEAGNRHRLGVKSNKEETSFEIDGDVKRKGFSHKFNYF